MLLREIYFTGFWTYLDRLYHSYTLWPPLSKHSEKKKKYRDEMDVRIMSSSRLPQLLGVPLSYTEREGKETKSNFLHYKL